MVHEAADGSGGVVVMAILFQLTEDGSTTDLLSATTEQIADINTPGTITETGALNFEPLVNHLTTTPLMNYTGSLTTPPCTEGITFLITQHPMPINVATYNSIKSVIKFNSRFTQNSLGKANLLDQAVLANEEAPVVEEAAPAAEETASATEEAAPAAEATAPAAEEAVAAAPNASKSEESTAGSAETIETSTEQLSALSDMLQSVDSAIHKIIG